MQSDSPSFFVHKAVTGRLRPKHAYMLITCSLEHGWGTLGRGHTVFPRTGTSGTRVDGVLGAAVDDVGGADALGQAADAALDLRGAREGRRITGM